MTGWLGPAALAGAVGLGTAAFADGLPIALVDLPGWSSDPSMAEIARTHVAVPISDPVFVTGYYEPELAASRNRTAIYDVPIYGLPDPADQRFDRADIEAGALDGKAPVLAWLSDPVSAFFLHVQGSGRLRLADGSTLRVGYAGRNRHPYVSIGRKLVARGDATAADLTADRLAAWLRADMERGRALMNENPSYIFFREVWDLAPEFGPVGAAGVQLSPLKSVAVDPSHWPYGTRFWLEAEIPGANGTAVPFAGIVVAEDTGAAIRGRGRLDLFFGTGTEAGRRAGALRATGRLLQIVARGEDQGQGIAQ